MTALSVIAMYGASVIPTGQLGVLAAASLFGVAAVVEGGIPAGAAVYGGSSLLGFLLVPNKNAVLLYLLFFGYYPILKAWAEKRKSRMAEWLIKLAVVNAALAVIFFAVSVVFIDLSKLGGSYAAAFLLCNAVFILFDIGVSRLTAFYVTRISGRIRRR